MRERPRIIGTGSVRRLLLDLKSLGLCGQWVRPFSPGRGIDLAAGDRWLKPLRLWVLYRKEKSLPYFHLEKLDRRHLNVKEGRTGLIMGHSRPGHSSSKRMRRLAERCIRNDILSSR